MPAPNQITFSFKEISEALIRQAGLHEGIWGVYVKFGLKATNIGEGPEDLRPAAIVPLLQFGLQSFDEVNSLSVDAAAVNPAPKDSAKKA